MAQKESLGEKASPLNLMPAEFAALGKERFDEFLKAQNELFGKLQETNREWLDRAQDEANLASEFIGKLTGARSIPDAMTICQEWTKRRFEMMAEDGKHLLADTQTFMDKSARLFANGWLRGNGIST